MVDGVQVDPRSQRDLERLAVAFRDGDKALQRQVRKGLTKAAAESAPPVIHGGAEVLPKSGGLSARVAASRGGVTAKLVGRNVSVSIRARTREGYALRKFNEGEIRHKVFGRWVPGVPTQHVRPHAFTEAFNRAAPLARAKVRIAVQQALEEIARKA